MFIILNTANGDKVRINMSHIAYYYGDDDGTFVYIPVPGRSGDLGDLELKWVVTESPAEIDEKVGAI